ncbi:MAG: aspartyl protease family protein [Saprospiraceae bacterium]|nr:aspartyl protease family protein [Saprospiraceae bacterium]
MALNAIETVFIKEGYSIIPFTFNGAGHPMAQATISNQFKTNIMLDTGASANLLDYDFAKEIGLNLTPTGEKGGGAGGLTLDIFSIEEVVLEISGAIFKFDNFLAMDFTTIKQSLTASGLSADFQGILGFGFFKMTQCFIDYSSDRIFILNKN